MKSITLVTCGLIGALNLAACSRKSPQAVSAAPEVLVIEAATRDVPVYREWIGTIDGSENADIRARVTGHLIKRNYNEGSLVKKGDVLFEIDPRPFEAALARAKGNLENARTALTEARGSYIDALRTYSAVRATLVRAPGEERRRLKP